MRTAVRSAWSCDSCRKRKVRCDSQDPCNNCVRRKEDCRWPENAHHKHLPVSSVAATGEETETRLARLEAALDRIHTALDRSGILRVQNNHLQSQEGPSRQANDQPNARSIVYADSIIAATDEVEIEHLAAVQHDAPIQHEVHRHDDFDHHIIDGQHQVTKRSHATEIRAHTIVSAVLPSKPLRDELLKSYLVNVEWIHHVLHVPDFQSRYNTVTQDDLASDLQWSALLLVVLCLGSHFSDHHRSVVREEQLYHGAQELLTLSDHLTFHSITTIQTLIMMGLWLNNRGLSNTHHAQLGLAIKMAMSLGLNRLDSRMTSTDADFFNVYDCPVADGSDLKRRIWWSLVCQDYYTASSCNFTYTIQPRQCKTELFSNVDDEDLPTPLVSTVQASALETSATSTSYQIVKIPFARVAKAMVDLYNEDSLSYEAVLELENLVWKLYDDLPIHFKWDSEGAMPASEHVNHDHLLWQRLFLGFTVHNRVLRLHRPFMTRGYTDAAMRHSRQATIESALACIDLAEQGQKIGFPGLKWWVVLVHIFTSGVALCIDYHFLLQVRKQGAEVDLTKLTKARRHQISRAIKLLRRAAEYDSVAARKALNVLVSLVKQAERSGNVSHSRKRGRDIDDGATVPPLEQEELSIPTATTGGSSTRSDLFMSPVASYDGDNAIQEPLNQDWLSSTLMDDWSGPDWDELLASMSAISPHGGFTTDLYDTVNAFTHNFMPG